jgi:hypothetical protein
MANEERRGVGAWIVLRDGLTAAGTLARHIAGHLEADTSQLSVS